MKVTASSEERSFPVTPPANPVQELHQHPAPNATMASFFQEAAANPAQTHTPSLVWLAILPSPSPVLKATLQPSAQNHQEP